MPGCVIILPKTIPPKTVSKRLDLSFGIFARRGEKYSCFFMSVRFAKKHRLNTIYCILLYKMR
ncbi:hypothetical protein COH63_12285 [Neisseria meningitidis]|nr:hypothetical protein [Neisseria meningitidis]RNJ91029.1 hypothetical protein COI31_10380 [Neisseria meningitidis]RQK54488.1 hypothetical protein COH63_12285 [Neisseria meningitidis]